MVPKIPNPPPRPDPELQPPMVIEFNSGGGGNPLGAMPLLVLAIVIYLLLR